MNVFESPKYDDLVIISAGQMIKINSVYISTIVVKPYPQVKYTLETGLYENIFTFEDLNVLVQPRLNSIFKVKRGC